MSSGPSTPADYGARILGILDQLGIERDYGERHCLPLQPECSELVSIGPDIHGREQRLDADAALAWSEMRLAAEREGIVLLVASAFRNVDYQAGIIARKMEMGQHLEQILSVSAAPGYSEHHTGCAIDVATMDSEPLEDDFENTPAFRWLSKSAGRFGFRLSYPRDNRHGIMYEPWHWFFTG